MSDTLRADGWVRVQPDPPLDPVPNPPQAQGEKPALRPGAPRNALRLTLREVGEYADALRPLFDPNRRTPRVKPRGIG